MFPAMAAPVTEYARSKLGSPRWLDKWLATVRDLAELERSNPMTDAVIDEIDGRMIRIGDKWLADFASCNYLGFDLDRQIIDSVAPALERWGTHPSWSRLLGSPILYPEIEERLAELVGAEDTLVLPTITLIHSSVIPILAGDGTIYVDSRAHKTIYEGCQVAAAHGATVKRFRHDDTEELARLLGEPSRAPRLICVDGINSMTGNGGDIETMARLAREHDALLYVDDAHGFGVIGERAADEASPYGRRGNGIVRHVGETYDHVLLVGGLSKSYSSLAAFIALPTELKRLLKTAAPPYLYSGPSPVASLATTLAGLQVNEERGDAIRASLWRKTATVLECLDRLGAHTPNTSGFPIVEVPLARADDVDAVGRFLFDSGIYVTLAAYPLVPRNEVGFRIQVTAANSQAEIEQLVDALGALAARFDLQPKKPAERAA
jgi:8-amino-7-oxononanoate synthase